MPETRQRHLDMAEKGFLGKYGVVLALPNEASEGSGAAVFKWLCLTPSVEIAIDGLVSTGTGNTGLSTC